MFIYFDLILHLSVLRFSLIFLWSFSSFYFTCQWKCLLFSYFFIDFYLVKLGSLGRHFSNILHYWPVSSEWLNTFRLSHFVNSDAFHRSFCLWFYFLFSQTQLMLLLYTDYFYLDFNTFISFLWLIQQKCASQIWRLESEIRLSPIPRVGSLRGPRKDLSEDSPAGS